MIICYRLNCSPHMRSRATALVLGAARALSAKHGRASTWPTMQPAGEVGYASFNYCAPDVTAVSTRRDVAGSDGELEGAAWAPTTVRIHDGRGRPWSLEKNGFKLVADPIDAIDLYDDAAVLGEYYGMCEALVAEQCPGATVVKAFDHNVRCEEGKASGRKLKGGSNVQAPAGLVHGDYTAVSAPRRLAQLSEAPKTNDALNKPPLDGVDVAGRRFAFVNVWRPISEVKSTPLACCDAATVRDDRDLLTFKIYYEDRVGENYFARHHEQHAWYYFPRMKREEALLIQQWDSKTDAAKFALHSAFADPSSPPHAPARESIEVRLVVVY